RSWTPRARTGWWHAAGRTDAWTCSPQRATICAPWWGRRPTPRGCARCTACWWTRPSSSSPTRSTTCSGSRSSTGSRGAATACAPTSAPRCSPVPHACSSWRTTSRSCPPCAAADRRRSSTAARSAVVSCSRASRSRSTARRWRTCRCAGRASCRSRNAPASPSWGETGASMGRTGGSGAQRPVLPDLRITAGAGAVRRLLGHARHLAVQLVGSAAAQPLLGGAGGPGQRILRLGGDLRPLLPDGGGGVLSDPRGGLLRLRGAALDLGVRGDSLRRALEGLVRSATHPRADHEADRESGHENEPLHHCLLHRRMCALHRATAASRRGVAPTERSHPLGPTSAPLRSHALHLRPRPVVPPRCARTYDLEAGTPVPPTFLSPASTAPSP